VYRIISDGRFPLSIYIYPARVRNHSLKSVEKKSFFYTILYYTWKELKSEAQIVISDTHVGKKGDEDSDITAVYIHTSNIQWL